MTTIAGLYYPHLDLIHPLLTKILEIQLPLSQPIQTHRHQFVEIGIKNSKIFYNKSKNIAIALSGFISNQAQLIEKLTDTIHAEEKLSFTDAQLILRCYEAWDTHSFSLLEGEFAFAIVDELKQEVVLVRDKFGTSSLYWSFNENCFLFSSEIKGILASDLTNKTIDYESICHYFYLGYIPYDMTPITEINALLPGHFLRYQYEHNVFIQEYWTATQLMERLDDYRIDEADFQKTLYLDPIQSIASPSLFFPQDPIQLYLTQQNPYITSVIPKQTPNSFFSFSALSSKKNRSIDINLEDINKYFVNIIWSLDSPIFTSNLLLIWKYCSLGAQENKSIISCLGYDLFHKIPMTVKITQHTQHCYNYDQIDIGFSYLLRLFGLKHALRYLKNHRKTHPLVYFTDLFSIFPRKLIKKSTLIDSYFYPNLLADKLLFKENSFSHPNLFWIYLLQAKLASCDAPIWNRFSLAHGLSSNTPYLSQKHLKKAMDHSDKIGLFPASRCKEWSYYNFLQKLWEAPETKRIFQLLLSGILIQTGILNKKWLQAQLNQKIQDEKSLTQLWSILTLETWLTLNVYNPNKAFSGTQTLLQLLTSF